MVIRTVLMILVVNALAPIHRVYADPGVPDLTVSGVSQRDLNGDGQPDLAILDCSFVTSQDRILVLDQGHDMTVSNSWSEATDFANDVWIFDAGADDQAELIVVFSEEDGKQVAYLYDDRDGNGSVSYQAKAERVEITESPYWTLKVISSSTWRLPDGNINFDLKILSDGAGGLDSWSVVLSRIYPEYVAQDGRVDIEHEIVDQDGDGVPDYQMWRRVGPVPGSWGIPRTTLVMRVKPQLPPVRGYILWPVLGDATESPSDSDALPSPIRVNWNDAQVEVGQVVEERYPPDNGWHINSVLLLEKDTLNELNFEYPMAWYDLADRQDGYPDLHVRIEYTPPHDRYFLSGDSPLAIGRVRYSWDQDHSHSWDYALQLVGRNRFDSIITFPDFSLQMTPYEELPHWVTGKTWDTAVFIAIEGTLGWGSEGIYFGGWRWLRDQYITGLSTSVPIEEYRQSLPSSYRMEYNFQFGEQPRLYLSPIDHKLHLFQAQGGLWRIDGSSRIEYEDVNEDGFIDQWTYYLNRWPRYDVAETVETLIAPDDFLIHSDGWHVNILNAKVPSSLFEATPPRDHEDWVRLGEQLKRYEKSFEPDDFEAMLSHFSGPLVRIVGARMEGFRLTSDGFRFVVELQPGFQIENPDLIQGATDLAPGAYLVTGGSQLSITRLTPPKVGFASLSLQLDPDQPVELESVDIKVVLHNDGLQDVESLPVVFYVEGPDGKTQEIDGMRVAVPGGGSKEVATTWVPRSPGEWRIQVEFDPGQTIPQLSGDVVSVWTSVSVSPAQQPGWQELLSLSVPGPLDFLVPLLFGCLVFAAAIALRLSITR